MVAILIICLVQSLQTDLRVMLDEAYKSETAAIEMRTYLRSLKSPGATEKAYMGTAEMLMAEHVYFPWSKLKHFHSGVDLIAQAAEMEPENLEVRYLRFACQTHTPSFLGYNDHIESDKKILITKLPELQDQDLKKRIKIVLLESKHVSEKEKERVK